MTNESMLLTVERSNGKSQTRVLSDGIYGIGRGPDNEICVQDQGISRRHARIIVSEKGIRIEDLGSKNGVLVNGQTIEGGKALRDGDQVVLGLAFLTFHRPDSVRRWIEESESSCSTVFRRIDSQITELQLETVAFDQKELVRATDDVKRLWVLYHTARAMSSNKPLHARLHAALDYLRMGLGYERALVGLRNSDGTNFAPVAVRSASGLATTVDEKLVNRVTGNRTAALTRVVDQLRGNKRQFRSVLCVPICLGEKMMGYLYVESGPEAQPYSGKDLDLVSAIANQAAFAVDNAGLIEQLKASRDRLERENVNLKEEIRCQYDLNGFIAQSGAMEPVKRQIRKVLNRDTTLLILGESGTGKEVTAKIIHYNSMRASRPFVALNCAAIPENLLESELFGIEAGVATGVQKRIGKFEQAADGTLFLDEIGEMSLSTQTRLLRVIQERQFERVGGHKPLRVQARIITATNRNLTEEVQEGRFREDLYYRLAVIPILLPPLRRRREDIPALAEHFLKLHSDRPLKLSGRAIGALCSYDWPGNIRELSNEIERATALVEGSMIDATDLSDRLQPPPHPLAQDLKHEDAGSPEARGSRLPINLSSKLEILPLGNLKELVSAEVERIETHVIALALQATRGNKLRAAKLLGLSREGLRKKLQRYRMTSSARG